jgi:hypothetical protein
MTFWHHGKTASLHHDIIASWDDEIVASASWHYGIAERLQHLRLNHGIIASLHHDIMVSLHHGFMTSWNHVSPLHRWIMS